MKQKRLKVNKYHNAILYTHVKKHQDIQDLSKQQSAVT